MSAWPMVSTHHPLQSTTCIPIPNRALLPVLSEGLLLQREEGEEGNKSRCSVLGMAPFAGDRSANIPSETSPLQLSRSQSITLYSRRSSTTYDHLSTIIPGDGPRRFFTEDAATDIGFDLPSSHWLDDSRRRAPSNNFKKLKGRPQHAAPNASKPR